MTGDRKEDDNDRRIGDNQVIIARDAFEAMIAELDELRKHALEFDLAQARIKELETENKWHRCDTPTEDGLFDLPPEPGDYLVEFVSNDNPIMDNDPCVMQSTFDPDYNDWDPQPFDCHARQWREMPKAPRI